jgi:hypothetical protein
MPAAHHATESFLRLELPFEHTGDDGPVRECIFRYCVVADYNGQPVEVRFGALLGWAESMDWWVGLANRLFLPSLGHLGLIDLEHQAGGHSCQPWFCMAAPVGLKDAAVPFVGELCRYYFHAHGGWMVPRYVNVDQEYRDRINSFGLTANCLTDRRDLMESVYPMDATDQNLVALLSEPSASLATLAPLLLDANARSQLRMYIIADNSD